MGYYWITTELVSGKKSYVSPAPIVPGVFFVKYSTRTPLIDRSKNVSQIANRSPRAGDLIITNYTSYIDILYLAFRHNPTFVLPIFAPLDSESSSSSTTTSLSEKTTTGRHTGTGSANISATTSQQPPFLGYLPIPLIQLLARTGTLPPTFDVVPVQAYKTLRAARRAEKRAVVLLAEGTTSNGRAVLKLPEGVLAEGDIAGDDEGIVWLKFFRYVQALSISIHGVNIKTPHRNLRADNQTLTPFTNNHIRHRPPSPLSKRTPPIPPSYPNPHPIPYTPHPNPPPLPLSLLSLVLTVRDPQCDCWGFRWGWEKWRRGLEGGYCCYAGGAGEGQES